MQQIIRQLAAEIKIGSSRWWPPSNCLTAEPPCPSLPGTAKEVTGGLDDMQLRELEARLSYLRELEDRRAAVLKAIDEQGLSSPGRPARPSPLRRPGRSWKTFTCRSSKKRRTKGQIAREFGIEPLADKLLPTHAGPGR